MKIEVISTFANASIYLSAARHGDADFEALWQNHMIAPFWPEITKWAPFDQSFKQPAKITELPALEKQLSFLSEVDTCSLQTNFAQIAAALPSDDDDPMRVFLYPLCDSNKITKERRSGVTGAAVFGNVIISINPLAKYWQKWVPFVFAHEYHHNIWGHNWFVLRGGHGISGTLLESMITEGQADLFAESLFPDLIPKWNRSFDVKEEKVLWELIKPVLFDADTNKHTAYMFGDESRGLPWCMGYSFGRMIVKDYMQKHPEMSFSELLDIPAVQIFEGSKYGKI